MGWRIRCETLRKETVPAAEPFLGGGSGTWENRAAHRGTRPFSRIRGRGGGSAYSNLEDNLGWMPWGRATISLSWGGFTPALRVASKINKRFGTQLTGAVLFENPTIERFCRLIAPSIELAPRR